MQQKLLQKRLTAGMLSIPTTLQGQLPLAAAISLATALGLHGIVSLHLP